MRRCRLFVRTGSTHLVKELNNYCWMRDANGNLLDKPIKLMDHAIDAARYAAYTMVTRPAKGARASVMKLG
jgi:phage terminase large subunit